MTGKAARKCQKRQRRQARREPSARSVTPWIVAGAVVATTAMARSPLHAQVLRSTTALDLPAAADAGDQPSRRIEIPAGPLAQVLAAYERITGIRIDITVEAMKAVYSPGVSGSPTAEEALQQILAGTSISARFLASQLVSLEFRGTAESVDVRGAAPGVSSPMYVAPLREVPQTIEVIPRAAIEEQGLTTLSEALRGVPGITLQAGEGGGASNTAGDMFNMRGFNAANSLFVDGVRDDGLISRDVFNLEQVEVFMGPTGTDVGRGTAAGYVNMQTKTPSLSATSNASFSYGSGDQKRATIDVGRAIPLAESGWLSNTAFRLNVLWQDSGVPGRDLVEQERRGVAPSMAFGLNTPTRINLSAQILRQDNLPDYGIPGAAWEEPLTPNSALAPRPVEQSNFYGSPAYDSDNGSQDSYTARIEHDVNSRLTLRNQTRYNDARRQALITTIQNVAAYNSANNLVTVTRQGNDRENQIFSNQTSLIDRFQTGPLNHAASLGLEFTKERQFAPTLGGVGTREPVDIFSPDTSSPVTGFAPVRTAAFNRGETETVALYGFDTIDLGARWQLSGGARWEHYDTRYEVADAAGVLTTNLGVADDVVSGKAGLLYRLAGSGNVYLSYGSTTTPPGTANFTLSAQANNVNNPSVEPQVSTNLEAGSKWDLADGRVSLNAAVFHTRNKNVIYTIDATAVPPIFNQDDAQEVNGMSVGVGGRLTPEWQVLGDFSYLDATLQSQGTASNGTRLTLTPEFSGSLWTTYRLRGGLTLGGGIRHTSAVFINAANTISSPGYQLVDGLVEYEVNTHFSLRLNIYNLTDEVYIRNVNNNGGRYNPGQPRSAMLTSAFRF